MKLDKIKAIVKGIPYTLEERGENLYNYIVDNRPELCLELGFAHGVASCYIAAALHEIGAGKLVCVDLESSARLAPTLEDLTEKAGIRDFVEIHREANSYTWFLKKNIERRTENGVCQPEYDFCFIDGAKNWTIDGMAFFCVDKLLKQGGTLLFDDYQWVYSGYSKDVMDGITIRDLSEDQIREPNIKAIFELLVMQHDKYSDFIIDEDWAWARKTQSDAKSVKVIASQSFKYKVLKSIRSLRGK